MTQQADYRRAAKLAGKALSRGWLDVDTLLIRAAGIVSLLTIPFKHLPHRLESFVPFPLGGSPHLIAFCLGLSLLYIANQVTLRKRNAWNVASISLICLILAELAHFHSIFQLGLYVVTFASLWRHRLQFIVRSDAESVRRGIRIAAAMLLVVILFAVVVFEVIDERAFGRDLSTPQTLSITWHVLTTGHLNDALPVGIHLHRYDRILLGSLRLSVLASMVIIIWSLFRPLRLRLKAPISHRLQAERIIEQHSASSEDFFKLWPDDKHYFFYGESFVAYKLSGTVALILDGATGRRELLSGLREAFHEFARLNGWTVAIIHADQPEAEAWQRLGSERLFIGSEATVDCGSFVQSTARNKHFRYVSNKAAKDNLTYELWQSPLSEAQINSLQRVSDAWLGHGGRREYTYFMGYFNRAYIRNSKVAVLQREGRVVAYANLVPSFAEAAHDASIDHMRFEPGISSVAMHYLLKETILRLYEQGFKRFNLGLVPLSKLDEQLEKSVSERVLAGIKTLGSRYYSSSGLEQFKGKFEPAWEPRYIVYQGAPTKLLGVGLALTAATAYRPRKRDWLAYILVGMAGLAGAAYAAFPAAVFLNRDFAWHGLVSDLGRMDQPYAWFFNSADIVSTALGLVVLAVVAHRYWPGRRQRLLGWALIAAFVSLCATAVTAVFVLPENFRGDSWLQSALSQPRVLLHGIFSFVNSAGFVLSAVLWAWPYVRRRAWNWRSVLAISVVVIGTVGTAVGLIWPVIAPWLQRVFILAYAVWLTGLVYDVTAKRRND